MSIDKLTKKDVCVFVRDYAHLEQLSIILDNNLESLTTHPNLNNLTYPSLNYLQFCKLRNEWIILSHVGFTIVKTGTFQKILEEGLEGF